jgi:hypothetical protein
MSTKPRVVSWFSCGVASAAATKLAKDMVTTKYPGSEFVIANCEIVEEHPDNDRFLKDCEVWFDQEIIKLGNDKYKRSIYEVFDNTKYLVGPGGARCTGELKKKVRYEFQQPDDVLVFGYTIDEQKRADRFIENNFDTELWSVLIDAGLTHKDCMNLVRDAGGDDDET